MPGLKVKVAIEEDLGRPHEISAQPIMSATAPPSPQFT